jgi:hypothetical protein
MASPLEWWLVVYELLVRRQAASILSPLRSKEPPHRSERAVPTSFAIGGSRRVSDTAHHESVQGLKTSAVTDGIQAPVISCQDSGRSLTWRGDP